MDLQTQLQELKTSTQAKLAEMRGEHSKELQELRVAVLGKKGSLTELLKGLKDLPSEERPTVGKMVNEVRDVLTEAFDEAAKVVEAAKIQAQLDSESLDVTLPGRQVRTAAQQCKGSVRNGCSHATPACPGNRCRNPCFLHLPLYRSRRMECLSDRPN